MMNREPSLQRRVLKTCEAVVPGTNRHMVKYRQVDSDTVLSYILLSHISFHSITYEYYDIFSRQDLECALKKQSRSRTATAVNHIVQHACATHFTSNSEASKKDTVRKKKRKHIHGTCTSVTIPEQYTDSDSESTEVGDPMQVETLDSILPAHQRVTRAMR